MNRNTYHVQFAPVSLVLTHLQPHNIALTPTLIFYCLAVIRNRFPDNSLLILVFFFGGGDNGGSISKRRYSVIGQSMDDGSNNPGFTSSLCGIQ